VTRKIDPESGITPDRIKNVTTSKGSSRVPQNWPGIPSRSQENEGEFVREGKTEEPADVTENQRRLEREFQRERRGEPEE
jgi:hypothetical protein